MMSDTSGPTSGTPWQPCARWSPSLRTWTDTGLLALPMSLGTLPTWGCLHGGELFELPTPERPTGASGSSSLPTPRASLGEKGRDAIRDSPAYRGRIEEAIAMLPTPRASEADHSGRVTVLHSGQTGLAEIANALLPTPVADHSRGLPQPGTDFQSLPNAVMDLLPTPTVNDMGAGKDPEWWKEWAARQKAADGRPAPHGRILEQEALSLLPTPTTQPTTGNGHARDLGAEAKSILLLPTPTVQQGRNATSGRSNPDSDHHDGWTLLDVVYAGLIGASTPPPLAAGSAPSADPHQHPPSSVPTDDHDCLPYSSNG